MTVYTKRQQANNRKKWFEGLRSGKYKQTAGYLSTKNEKGKWAYCCLGVACEIAMENGVELEVMEQNVDGVMVKFYNGEEAHLPDAVQTWLGFDNETGAFKKGENEESLIVHNDGDANHKKKTFKKIADLAESRLKELVI